jgi:hypothetical protein
MKKTLLLLVFLVSAAFYANAQNNDAPTLSAGFSVGATTGVHSGDFPVASGVHLKLEYPLSDSKVSLIFTTGYTFYVSSNGYSDDYYDGSNYSSGDLVAFVPVELGARIYVHNRFFLQGDAGASFNVNSTSSDYTNKKVALLVSPSAGYALPFGRTNFGLDFSLGYEARIETAGGLTTAYYPVGSYNQVVFRLAFRFGM